MRAISFVKESTRKVLGAVHQKRQAALWYGVDALIQGGRLCLTQIGRAGGGSAFVKHKIKRIDRLIGNTVLFEENFTWFQALACWLLNGVQRPVILIDWTESGFNKHALVASLPFEGRALTIYAEVYPTKKCGNRRIEQRFLRRLKNLIPASCCPILVTDAGFRTPWFDTVRTLGWDFVGRLRHRHLVKAGNGLWVWCKSLYKEATRRPKCLGQHLVTRSRPRLYRMVIVNKGSKKPRHTTNRSGKRSQTRRDMVNRPRAKEPWLLVTSSEAMHPRKVVHIYAKRMQIEETFRDLKSHRFGWAFEDARSNSISRLTNYWILAAYAYVALVLLGLICHRAGMQKRLQANTVKRRIFSYVFLAMLCIYTRQQIPNTAPKPFLKQIVDGFQI